MLPNHNAQVASTDATFTEKLDKNEKQKKVNEGWTAFSEFGCALLIACVSLQVAWQNTHGITATSLPSSFPTGLPTYDNTTNIHAFSGNHHAMNDISITIKIVTALATFVALGPKNFSTFLNLRNMRQTLKEYLESNDNHIKDIQFIRYKLIVKLAVRGIFSNNSVVAEALSLRLIEEFTQAHFTQHLPAELQKVLTLARGLFEGNGYAQSRVWAIFPLLLITIAVVSAVLLSNLFQPENTTKNSVAIIGFCVSLVLALSTVLSYILGHSDRFRSLTSISTLEQAIDVIKSTEQNAELLIDNLLRQLGNTNSTAVSQALEELNNTQAKELLSASQTVTLLLVPQITVSTLGMFRHTALDSLESIELTTLTDYQNMLDDSKQALANLQLMLRPYKFADNTDAQIILKTRGNDLSNQSKYASLLDAVTRVLHSLKPKFSQQTEMKIIEISNALDAFTEITNKLTLSLKVYNDVKHSISHLRPRI